MSPTELVKALHRLPFEPFRLWLHDGTYHDVTHPDLMIVGVRSSYIGIPTNDVPDLAEHVVCVNNRRFSNIEPLSNTLILERVA